MNQPIAAKLLPPQLKISRNLQNSFMMLDRWGLEEGEKENHVCHSQAKSKNYFTGSAPRVFYYTLSSAIYVLA